MATFGTFASGQVLTAAELNSAGTWSAYTPTWTQSVAITKTVNWARYTQLNKFVQGSIRMTATGAGTADNKIIVGLPVAASANNFMLGIANFRNVSESPDVHNFFFVMFESSTTVSFSWSRVSSEDFSLRFGQTASGPSGTIEVGDIIHVQFAYEAA
jgi:hypothetical protein